jgi:hypothetical protein
MSTLGIARRAGPTRRLAALATGVMAALAMAAPVAAAAGVAPRALPACTVGRRAAPPTLPSPGGSSAREAPVAIGPTLTGDVSTAAP